jgi:hypothetical protein
MPSAGFETATPATKRPQIYSLDRAAAEVGCIIIIIINFSGFVFLFFVFL